MERAASRRVHGASSLTPRHLPPISPRDCRIRGTYQRPYTEAYRQLAKMQEFRILEETFKSVDLDGSGQVTLQEFQACMQDPVTFCVFNKRFGLQLHETPRVFRALDRDGSGAISISEFVETCRHFMDVVQEGDVITNWRVRAVKEKLAGLDSVAAPRVTARGRTAGRTLLPRIRA
mmetsp:Transcript_50474/g.141272  ORF Transcript_50474/g.141272 Transcript_50474/m.141272 type:complete len:176 (-) Transcript_50474:27-554(-)